MKIGPLRIGEDSSDEDEIEPPLPDGTIRQEDAILEEDRIYSEELDLSDTGIIVFDRFIEGSGVVEGLDYTGSVLPGNIATTSGNINVVIDRYSRGDEVGAVDGLTDVSNFYTGEGSLRVIVNDWDDELSFAEVEKRIRESPNFTSVQGDLEVLDGRELEEDVDQDVTGDVDEDMLILGDYVEQPSFSRDRMEEDWRKASRAVLTNRDLGYYSDIEDAVEKDWQEAGEKLFQAAYRNGFLEEDRFELTYLRVSIHGQTGSIDDWYEALDEMERVMYREDTVSSRNFYKRQKHRVSADIVRDGLELLEEEAENGIRMFGVSMEGLKDGYAVDENILEAALGDPSPSIDLDPAAAIGFAGRVSMDLGLLGLLPYHDEIEEHIVAPAGSSLPEVLGQSRTQELLLEDYGSMSEEARHRLETLASHGCIGMQLDKDRSRAEVMVTNSRGNQTLEVGVEARWDVERFTARPTMTTVYDELIRGTMAYLSDGAVESKYDEPAGSFITYQLYNRLEDVLDVDWRSEDGTEFDTYREDIRDTKLDPRLFSQEKASHDLFIAVNEYVDRRP